LVGARPERADRGASLVSATAERAHIGSYTADQVWYSGTVYCVVDRKGTTVHEAMLFGKLRCKLWALFHGYGWLPVQ
jgi:hypothetical protein